MFQSGVKLDLDTFPVSGDTSSSVRPSKQPCALSVSLWLADSTDTLPRVSAFLPPPALFCTSSVKLRFVPMHVTTVMSSSVPEPGQVPHNQFFFSVFCHSCEDFCQREALPLTYPAVDWRQHPSNVPFSQIFSLRSSLTCIRSPDPRGQDVALPPTSTLQLPILDFDIWWADVCF